MDAVVHKGEFIVRGRGEGRGRCRCGIPGGDKEARLVVDSDGDTTDRKRVGAVGSNITEALTASPLWFIAEHFWT